MHSSFEWFRSPAVEYFANVFKKVDSSISLGHLSTRHKHGIRSLPIFAEMRPRASGFTLDSLNAI